MVRSGFTSGEASRLSGVPLRRLDFWAVSKFIPPSIAEATGKGSERKYSFADVMALRVANELRGQGISLQALRRVVEHLRMRGYDRPLSETYLIAAGGDVFERQGDELVSTLRRPGQAAFIWVLDLDRIVREVRALLAA